MSYETLLDKIQLAIGNPENKYKYPYARTKTGNLHVYLIDPKKAAERVLKLIEDELPNNKG
jgi:hypothetical protein